MNIKSSSCSNNDDMEGGIVNETDSLIERCIQEEAVQMSDIIAAATKGCSLSYTLSGVSNIEKKLRQVMFNKVVSQSLNQVIANYFYLHLRLMADKTNLLTPSFPTTNCF